MAYIREDTEWAEGIYQIELDDPVEGGPDGIDNLQAQALAARTQFLKKGLTDLEASFTEKLRAALTEIASGHYTKEEIDALLAGLVRYKGSVENRAALPQENVVAGDMYNVVEDGKNYIWDGTKWDDTAGLIDLSGYVTHSQLEEALAGLQALIPELPDQPGQTAGLSMVVSGLNYLSVELPFSVTGFSVLAITKYIFPIDYGYGGNAYNTIIAYVNNNQVGNVQSSNYIARAGGKGYGYGMPLEDTRIIDVPTTQAAGSTITITCSKTSSIVKDTVLLLLLR
jgi:hypothetical protein